MTNKFTPGPWEIEELTMISPINIWKEDEFLAEIISDSINSNSPPLLIARTNAKLISAAPDMYEALKELIEMDTADDWRENNRPSIVKARAALKKAEGGAA